MRDFQSSNFAQRAMARMAETRHWLVLVHHHRQDQVAAAANRTCTWNDTHEFFGCHGFATLSAFFQDRSPQFAASPLVHLERNQDTFIQLRLGYVFVGVNESCTLSPRLTFVL
jgi:hypothetical protein